MVGRVELLGPPVVLVDGERFELPSHRMAALLCCVAFWRGWARRDALIALLWSDVAESRARNRFRQLLYATRSKYPFADIESRGDMIRWRVPTDVANMDDAANDAVRVDANHGWFLEGLHLDDAPDFESWIASERTAIHARWKSAALRLTAALLRDDRVDDALEILERLERRDPLDEEIAQRQISLLRRVHPERAAIRYRDLSEAMDRELNMRPSEETRAIAEGRFIATDLFASSPASLHAAPDALPVGATEFVGRKDEVAEAEAILVGGECRLLTVFAPGGMGKTRLALELGARCASNFRNGAVFVSLVHARTTEAALASIAEGLRVTVYGSVPVQRQIADAIGDRPTLLILDNLEQLELARELLDLLEHAPGLTILATSRRRIGIRAEWSHALDGMAYPPGALQDDAPAVDPEAWDATRLFVRRARQRRRDLGFDDTQRRAVGRIAARLGGMPLALELAARWTDVLQPTDIDAELAARAGLEGADSERPDSEDRSVDRHRSVHFVLEQSWRRLDDREQGALRRLSVLHGFTVDAARAVAAAEPRTIRELIDHALLTSTPSARAQRFSMHPLVQSFCAARASEDPVELAATRDAHARHYLGWAAEVNDEILSTAAARILKRLYEETDNLRAAWLRGVERGFDDRIGAAIKPLEFAFRSRTWYRIWGDLLRHAHDQLESGSLTHARLAMSISANRLDLLDVESARREGERIMPRIDALTSETGARINPHPPAEVRRILGHVALAQGRPDEAVARFEAALEILQRDEVDPHFAARVMDYLGTAHAMAGQPTEGKRWLERAVRMLRFLEEPGSLAVAATNLARLELHRGCVDRALELSSEALRLEREIGGRPRFFVEQLRTASDALRVAERYDEAAALLGEELAELERTPMPMGARQALEARDRLGQIAYLRGDLEEAGRHLHGALTPRACRLALLQNEPKRAKSLCARWLEQTSPPAYLTLDLDRFADRAFVLACMAEASLTIAEDPASLRTLLGRALRFATARSLIPEVLRGATLLAWFHAEHGEVDVARDLLSRVATDPATDPEARALARAVTERFDLEQDAPENEAPVEPLETIVQTALVAAGIEFAEASSP